MTATVPEPVGRRPPPAAHQVLAAQVVAEQHLDRRWQGQTYYGRNVVKPSPFSWMVWVYIFIGGLSGSAAILAALAELIGDETTRGVVSRGRHIAALGALAGAPLLISDLHTPQRFFNMLRIYRATSPMSIGSWILTGFGAGAAVTSGADLLGWRGAARAAQVPTALLGAGMSVYTAALLSATSTPLWAAAPRLLAARFGASAMASAAAALSLLERNGGTAAAAKRLDRVAVVAIAAELAVSLAARKRYRAVGVDRALREGKWAVLDKIGATGIGMLLPLGCHAFQRFGRQNGKAAVAAAIGILVGSLMMRASIMYAGQSSASSGPDYFRFTERPRPERGG
jgi:protein NrfD